MDHPGRPLLSMRWLDLLFAHWPIEPAVLRPLIPAPLELDTFDGSAWLGVVPFRMTHVRPLELPLPGGAFAFAEVNVRTYVTAPDGTRGIWFLSLDGAHWPSATAARLGFGVPYHHARVTSSTDGDWIRESSSCTHALRPPSSGSATGRPARSARRSRGQPRGVPHRPDVAVRRPARAGDADAGRARGRGRCRTPRPRSSATRWPRRSGSSCRRRRPTCCSPAGWTPSPIARGRSSIADPSRSALAPGHVFVERMRASASAIFRDRPCRRLSVTRIADSAMYSRGESWANSNEPQLAKHSGHAWMARSAARNRDSQSPGEYVAGPGRAESSRIRLANIWPGAAGGRCAGAGPGLGAATRAATISAWRTS